MSEFSDLLKKYRERAKISQKKLAELAEIDQSHLNRLERGVRKPPNKRIIIAIANALMLGKEDMIELLRSAGHELPEDPLPHDSRSIAPGASHKAIDVIRQIILDNDIPVIKKKQILDDILKYAKWRLEDTKKDLNKP